MLRYKYYMQIITTNYLVIGSGVAGLRAAIELGATGKVIVVTKDIPTESSTEYAQGGVAVAMSDEDEVGIHFEDTIKAGDGLCRKEAVKILVEEGPARIMELIEWGAKFDKDGTKLAFTLEAAHSRKRVLHAHGDSTGKELERVLINRVMSMHSIQRYPFCMAIDLIMEEGACKGAYILRSSASARIPDVMAIYAKATILATGGAGQVFSRTTNPIVATGDGIAIAYRAGAVLEDMEFVQFHPTVLFAASAPHFLLTEAMRGEGAVLRNTNKESFMKTYHPDAELAPRDIVSRAIISEMVRTKSSHVYLDLTHLNPEFIKHRFPMIYSTCLQYQIDILKDMIPVSPAAHYMMGGVKTDINGTTNIPNLFAAGEVACTGVHGANRLASNSLLEGLVYGYRTGAEALKQYEGEREVFINETKDFDLLQGTAHPANSELEGIRESIRQIMWERVGIIRCGVSLNIAMEWLAQKEFVLNCNFDTRRGLELKNILTVASLITKAALKRKESSGAHYRTDSVVRDMSSQQHIQLMKNEYDFQLS